MNPFRSSLNRFKALFQRGPREEDEERRPSRLRSWASWTIDAARVEPRVAVALAVCGMIWAVSSLAWAFVIFASGQGPVAGFIGWAFLTLVVSTGLSLPLFIPLAWPALWLRLIYWTEEGYDEHWVNPAVRFEEPYNRPGFMRKLNGKRYLGVLLNGDGSVSPFPTRRTQQLYSTTQVHKATNKQAVRDHFQRRGRLPQLPVKAGALAGIIGLSLFLGYALVSNPEAFG